MSETGDQFDGASERSTKHSPRVDDELEHEMQGMLRAERSTRAAEWREVEPEAEGDPNIDADPADPGGMGSTGPAIEDGGAVTVCSRTTRVTSGRAAGPPSLRTLRDRIAAAIAHESEVCVPIG